jgi:hypothetical protein
VGKMKNLFLILVITIMAGVCVAQEQYAIDKNKHVLAVDRSSGTAQGHEIHGRIAKIRENKSVGGFDIITECGKIWRGANGIIVGELDIRDYDEKKHYYIDKDAKIKTREVEEAIDER